MGDRVQLTRHFWLHEFERSAEAVKRGIDNSVPKELLPNVLELAGVMELIRAHLGNRVITVTSGHRCFALNSILAGASATSEHMKAGACDFLVAGLSPYEVCTLLAPKVGEFKIDQLILEYNQWTHVGLAIGRTARGEILSYTRGPQGIRKHTGIVT